MATSYIERGLSFGVDEFEDLWRVQFLHPYFFGDTKQYLTVYVVPSNSDFVGDTYKGSEVVKAGSLMMQVIDQLLPRIEKYPYRWELEGKKLDPFGYDLVCGMVKGGNKVLDLDFTDIAFQEVSRYYSFTDPTPKPDIVTETEEVDGDGAMVKLQVTLEKAQWVNKVAFDFFTEYPVQVLSLMYQEDTRKYAPVYEIALEKTALSSSSLSFHFPSVFAKRFTVIIQQPTYTIGRGMVLPEQKQKEELWDYLLSKTIAPYLESNVDTQAWQQQTQDYYGQLIETKGVKETPLPEVRQEWRPAYYQQQAAYEREILDYEEALRKEAEARKQYEKDMKEYVRYQNSLAEWHMQWGG